MKPSERLLALLPLWYSRDRTILENPIVKAFCYVLDEEAAKPKYACPNCHRVVDELIGRDDGDGYMLVDEFGIPLDPHCKHCCSSIKGEKDGNV